MSERLVEAAKYNDLILINQFILDGDDIHYKNELALHTAIVHGFIDAIEYLHQKGANIHIWNDHFLEVAVRWGDYDTIKYLLDNEASILNLQASDKHELFIKASLYNDKKVVKLLLPYIGKNFHKLDDSALRLAVTANHHKIVKLLLRHGEDYKQNYIDKLVTIAVTNSSYKVLEVIAQWLNS